MPANPPGRRGGPGGPYDEEYGWAARRDDDARYPPGQAPPEQRSRRRPPPTRAEPLDPWSDSLDYGPPARAEEYARHPYPGPARGREPGREREGAARWGGRARVAATRAERWDLQGERRGGRPPDAGHRGPGPEPRPEQYYYYREGSDWQVGSLSWAAVELDTGLYERQMAGLTALISLANEVGPVARITGALPRVAGDERTGAKRGLIARLRQDEMTWNSLFLVMSTGLQSGTGFIFWIITAHLFSVSDVGKGSALISGMNLIGSLALLGLNIGMGRYLPSARNRDALISSALAMVGVVAAIGALVYILLTPYIAPGLAFVEKSLILTVGFALMSAAVAVNTLTDVIFIASRKAKFTTFVDGVIAGFGKLILAALLTGLGAYGVFLASALGTVMAAVASLLLIWLVMRVRISLRHPVQTLKPLIRFSAANYVGNVIVLFDSLIVPIIILDRLGAESSAYFFVVFQMAQIVYTAGLALEQTFLAEGSRADADMRHLRRRSLRLLVFFFVLTAAFMIGVGRWLLLAFGHTYYQHGYLTLIALTIAAGPVSASYWFQTILRLAGKLRAIIVVNVIAAVVTVATVWFASAHGLNAVAWAWLVSCTVAALAAGIAAREKKNDWQHIQSLGPMPGNS